MKTMVMVEGEKKRALDKQFNQFPVLGLALLDELRLIHQLFEREVSPLLFKQRVDCRRRVETKVLPKTHFPYSVDETSRTVDGVRRVEPDGCSCCFPSCPGKGRVRGKKGEGGKKKKGGKSRRKNKKVSHVCSIQVNTKKVLWAQ